MNKIGLYYQRAPAGRGRQVAVEVHGHTGLVKRLQAGPGPLEVLKRP